ncbi:hypothetical protein L226DRAFT_575828 [Lentinus tigrinus ALCF2SS1-7]|uniref:Uncharacterized protein n=1 Tax=Lentinus tigrinus ALCF2SS1-6 TaxID=1328759 RepID=A0A5C2RSE5_9APHY|nr:hypothetical protein L227DRAFT_616317 [Lentinus tigrinus ALCF2SS1-6]RPD69207.1 hypothetical protein L226DRAFT_575828 [Lentinus tigrinus ALCF2SS1-7]
MWSTRPALDEFLLVLKTSYGLNETSFARGNLANKFCNAYAQLGAWGTSVFCSGDNGVYSFSFNSPDIPDVATSFSWGDFSDIFARPDYQSAAVEGYLDALESTNDGLFSLTGRTFSDVSKQLMNFIIRINGMLGLALGTSASTSTSNLGCGETTPPSTADSEQSLALVQGWMPERAFARLAFGVGTARLSSSISLGYKLTLVVLGKLMRLDAV